MWTTQVVVRRKKSPHATRNPRYARPISFHWMGGGGHMSHMSLLRFVLTLIVCPQKAYVEGGHRSRRVEVPQNQSGHYHVWLRAMLLCPCTLGCRRSAGFLRQASVLRRAARNQDASNGWRVPRRLQVTLHKYDYQGRHASQVRPSSPRPVLQVLLPYKA